MSTEDLFRQLLQGQKQVTVAPSVSLSEMAKELGPEALGRLTVDKLRLDLQPDEISDVQQQIVRLLYIENLNARRVYDLATANTILQLLADLAAVATYDKDHTPNIDKWKLELAADALLGLHTNDIHKLQDSLGSFVSHQSIHNTLSFALSAIAGKMLQPSNTVIQMRTNSELETNSDNNWFVDSQLNIINALSVTNPKLGLQIAQCMCESRDVMDDDQVDPPGLLLYAQSADFIEQARPAIEKAAEHVERIHNGEIPFKADKAFSKSGSIALARYVNVALDQNESWLPAQLEILLTKVSTAPDPKVKTPPSQSAAYAIAQAIAERPNIPAWLTLKNVSAEVKHAALKKRFLRLCRKAEQRLTSHHDFLRRWPHDMEIPKALNAGVKRAFEKMLITGDGFSSEEFNLLLTNKGLATVATSLVWTGINEDGSQTSFRLAKQKGTPHYVDISGDEFRIGKEIQIRPLHPLDCSDAELKCWRNWMIDSKIKQPFNQLFRETYQYDDDVTKSNLSTYFANYAIDAKILIGLASAVGWHLSKYEGFKLNISGYLFIFDCGSLYPGYNGIIDSGPLMAFLDHEPVDWQKLPPRILSEAYRATDLLVSVAIFTNNAPTQEGLAFPSSNPDESNQPGYTGAINRLSLLKRLYSEDKNSGRPYIDGRYLCMDDVRIHCGTGRASRLGETLEIPTAKGTATLPYPDVILAKIIKTVNSL